jgi:hypothetical protein
MARQAGFTGLGLVTIVAISVAEASSTCSRNPSGATGILQFMPGTASHYGLTDATDPQASFDAAYRLSQQGTVFSAWSTYTGGQYQQHVADVQRAAGQAATASSASSGGNPVSGAISGAVGTVRGSLASTGQAVQSGGQVLIGTLIMAAGGALLVYLLLTRTDAGRGIMRGARNAAGAAIAVVPK